MKVVVVPETYHNGEIHAIDMNRDGKILTCGGDNQICQWPASLCQSIILQVKKPARKLRPLKTHTYHNSCVNVVRWSLARADTFASGDAAGNLYLNKAGKPTRIFPIHEEASPPAPTPSQNTPDANKEVKTEDVKSKYQLLLMGHRTAKVDTKDQAGTLDATEKDTLSETSNETPADLNPQFNSAETGLDSSTGVVDLSWSSEGRLLCWSTQDRKLHLYDIENKTYQEFKSLTVASMPHQAAVLRSICFDPTGNFLITLGDDSLIHLYQYKFYKTGMGSTTNYQFRQIHRISKLVNNLSLNANYKRISWSPDGEFVSIPTANKNLTSLVSLISRSKNWTNALSLVGHDINCEVVKFNPHYYQLTDDDSGDTKTHPYSVIATAGSDNTLVLWNTSSGSPISILKEISKAPISDVAWSKDGDALLAVTMDGHITAIKFEQEELGYPADSDVVEEFQEAGRKLIKDFDHKDEAEVPSKRGQANKQQEPILDQKDAYDEKSYPKKDEIKDETELKNKAEQHKSDVGKLDEDSTADTAAVSGDIEPEVIPQPDLLQSSRSDILLTVMERPKGSEVREPKKGKEKEREKEKEKPKDKEKEKKPEAQKVTTKNGKKRIQPMLISSGSSSQSAITSAGVTNENVASGSAIGAVNSSMDFDKPSYSVTDDVFKQSKRARQPEANGSAANGTSKKLKRQLEPVKFIETVIVNPNTTFAKVRLSVPKVRLSFQLDSTIENEQYVLDIKNGSGNESKPSRITYYKKDREIWSDFVPRFLQLSTEGKSFWALSTMDGQILIYSKVSGRRLLPPMIMGSPLSFLESQGDFLMAVTSVGELYVWDVALRKIHLQSPSTLSSVLELSNKYKEDGLSKADNITMCSITSKGVPLLTLSNGTGYLFNRDLNIWQTISESWWAFGSHYWDSFNNDNTSKSPSLQTSSLIGGGGASIIGLLEQKTNEEIIRKTRIGRGKYFNKISKNMIMKEGFESLENTISLSHLENRILCCELLEETDDFKKFLMAYAKRVCELSLKSKLYEICTQLMGPSSEDAATDWVPTICGLEKHKLLEEIIVGCSQHRDSQRILLHFAKELNLITEGEV